MYSREKRKKLLKPRLYAYKDKFAFIRNTCFFLILILSLVIIADYDQREYENEKKTSVGIFVFGYDKKIADTAYQLQERILSKIGTKDWEFTLSSMGYIYRVLY